MRALRVVTDGARNASFDGFVAANGDRLRRALVARHGVDDGCDLANVALGYAWEHWDRVGAMDNPVGYLYRVAENAGRKQGRWRRPTLFPVADTVDPATPVDEALSRALSRLSDVQRTSVVLVHVFAWRYADVGALLDVPVTTVRNHVHRGLTALRLLLEDDRHG